MPDVLFAAVARGMMQGFRVLLWLVRGVFMIVAGFINRRDHIPNSRRHLDTTPSRHTQSVIAPVLQIYGTLLTILLPQNTKWDGRRAHQFIEQILVGFPALVFRIVGTQQVIQWQIIDLVGSNITALETAIRASYPEATVLVKAFEIETPDQYPMFRTVLKYKQSSETFLAPLLYVTDLKHPDPLASIVEVMGSLQDGERLIYHLFVEEAGQNIYREGEKHIKRNVYDGSVMGFINPQKADRYMPEITRVLSSKLQSRLYRAALLIQIDTPHKDRMEALFTVNNHVVGFSRPQFGDLQWIADGQGIVTLSDTATSLRTSALAQYRADQIRSNGGLSDKGSVRHSIDLVLDTQEIVALWHLPHEAFTASAIQWAYGKTRIPNALRGKTEGVYIGTNQFAGCEEPVYIPDRSSHVSIIGKTGVGKTTFMHQLIHQDIASGKGVAVIDPHGKLISDILGYSIPPDREQDVVVLDIADERYPIPLNLLAASAIMDEGNAAAQLMGILDRLYDFSSTPTVADTMWACLVTLSYHKNATIRDAARLLTDDDYRDRLLSVVTNVAAIEFWERFGAQTGSREHLVRPVLWRLRALYGNSVLYPIFCHPDTLDLASFIEQGKILLISLKAYETRIPMREQNLVGLILLSKLQQTAMARHPGSALYYLYVDEVQHFITTTFDTLLSEARKYGLSLTTANQYLKQLTGGMLESIMGNVGTMIAFQTGLADAKMLAPYFTPTFSADHLMHLDAFEAAVMTRYKAQSLPAFSIRTPSPLYGGNSVEKAKAREQHLRHLSRERYIPKSREEVLTWLSEKYPVSVSKVDPIDEITDFE